MRSKLLSIWTTNGAALYHKACKIKTHLHSTTVTHEYLIFVRIYFCSCNRVSPLSNGLATTCLWYSTHVIKCTTFLFVWERINEIMITVLKYEARLNVDVHYNSFKGFTRCAIFIMHRNFLSLSITTSCQTPK